MGGHNELFNICRTVGEFQKVFSHVLFVGFFHYFFVFVATLKLSRAELNEIQECELRDFASQARDRQVNNSQKGEKRHRRFVNWIPSLDFRASVHEARLCPPPHCHLAVADVVPHELALHPHPSLHITIKLWAGPHCSRQPG